MGRVRDGGEGGRERGQQNCGERRAGRRTAMRGGLNVCLGRGREREGRDMDERLFMASLERGTRVGPSPAGP
jgi:hypothetical protein